MSDTTVSSRDSESSQGPLGWPRTPLRHTVFAIAMATALAHLYFNTYATLPPLWVSALHFGSFGLLCALSYRANGAPEPPRNALVLVIDAALGIGALASAVYLILAEDALYARGVTFASADWVFSGLALVTVLELVRRTTGWLIPIVILLALSYVVWWGALIGGVFAFPGLSVETVLYRVYFGSDGMFGSIATISRSYVFMFILFGAFLIQSGAGNFIIRLAQAAAGRMSGGPGFVAVLGSGLMGSISGSAVANTVSTGVMTIPLMKRTGFPPRFSAGVEAAASTGGQLMPPVMGAGAFIMSNFTQIPYLDIVGAALLPALLYFLSVAFYVRIEARRLGLTASADDGLSFAAVMREGWIYLGPIVVLVAMLVAGFTPTFAAAGGIVGVVAASWLSPHPMRWADIGEALVNGARMMAPTAMLLVSVGLVVNAITTTGIGTTFSLMVNEWAAGSLLLTLVFVALASLILGMGLPVTASYIVLATLSAAAIHDLMMQSHLVDLIVAGEAPEMLRTVLTMAAPSTAEALNAPVGLAEAQAILAQVPREMMGMIAESALSAGEIGAMLLAAHLIIFWLSQDSNVTPPVCLTAFAAAGIAGTKPLETGLTAWKIAKGLYLVPILLAYTPLVTGDWGQALTVFVFAVPGLYGAAGLLHGHLEGPLSLMWRLPLLGAVLLLLWPHTNLVLYLLGLALFALVLFATRGETQNPQANPS